MSELKKYISKMVEIEKADGPGGMMRFLITSGALDRDDEIVDPDGLDVSEYQNNPVVLWSHDLYKPAVGRGIVERTAKGWEGGIVWPPEGIYPEADLYRKLYENGILHAVSIRFMPTEPPVLGKLDSDGYSRKYTKSKLLEFSLVNVPSNPESLRTRSAGQLNEWLKSVGIKANIEDYILQPGEPGGRPFTKEELLEMARRYNDTPAKAGSELSKKNRSLIRSVRDRLKACHDEIDEMVRRWADEEAEDEAEPAEEEEPKSVSVPTTPQDTPGAEPGAQSKTVDGEEVQDVRVIDLPILIDEAKIEELVRQRVAAGLAEAERQREDYLTGKSAVEKAMLKLTCKEK